MERVQWDKVTASNIECWRGLALQKVCRKDKIPSALGKTKGHSFFFCCPCNHLCPRIYRMMLCGYFPAHLGNLSEKLAVGPTEYWREGGRNVTWFKRIWDVYILNTIVHWTSETYIFSPYSSPNSRSHWISPNLSLGIYWTTNPKVLISLNLFSYPNISPFSKWHLHFSCSSGQKPWSLSWYFVLPHTPCHLHLGI